MAAVLTWAAVAAMRSLVLDGRAWPAVAVTVSLAVCATRSRRLPVVVVASLIAGATISGIGSGLRESATLQGVPIGTPVEGAYRVVSDPISGRWGGLRFLVRSDSGQTFLVDAASTGPRAGERWSLSGRVTGPAGRWRGIPHAGVADVRRAVRESPGGVFAVAANAARARVAAVFGDGGSAAGLVSGFLIGETTDVSAADLAAMRASGLSHFVAVSGSNVALFLGLWWIVTFFTGFTPRSRAVVGMLGLILFVWITRWEPSVVRAAVMASLILAARVVGVPLTGWSALGAAVTGIALVSGELVESVGFQLSVAATCGVMAGHRLVPLRIVGPLLSATLGAQIAVAPLLIVHFGSVPLVAPLANLAAVPLVTGATALGVGATVSGWTVPATAARWLGEAVLTVARVGAGFPQVGIGLLMVGLLTAAGWRWAPVRVLATGFAGVVLMWSVVRPPPVPSGMVVLDVGQGDSILLLGDEGGVVLVDGGPDGTLLLEKLRRYRVARLDLVVNTHPHHDHTEGLVAVLDSMPVGQMWRAGFTDEEGDELSTAAADAGVGVSTPGVGTFVSVGGIRLEVLGPVRRYASPNDQSVVMVATVNDVSIALVGDIETHAQADLGPVPADVLKVPHQGAATSDLGWIRESAGALAVISVGPNSFGHPSREVIEALGDAGAVVVRTDQVGDVVIRSRRDVLER